MNTEDQDARGPGSSLSPALLNRIARCQWTAHNLQLAPGVWTLPGSPDFLATDRRLAAIVRLCRALYGPDLDGVRALDLGCLEGGVSVGLALAGADVVGVEARSEHVEKCAITREALGLSRLTFVRADVKKVTTPEYGTFDVVLALGILYHLDDPVGWLRRVGSLARRVLFIDTHYAPDNETAAAAVRPGLRQRLGPLQQLEFDDVTVTGRWFDEWSSEDERDHRPWTSWSNPRSLWLTKESLANAVRHAGFDCVLEQYDHWMDRYAVFTGEYPRTMFVGLRSNSTLASAPSEHRALSEGA